MRVVHAGRAGRGVIRIAYFGLPIAALLLSSDGYEPALAVLAPVDAPGARRLRRRLGDRVIDARGTTRGDLERMVGERLQSTEIDLFVSWYWTRRFTPDWLSLPRLGAIGAHPSILPRHRGPDPFFWAIDSGDVVTGVSIHYLTERYDEGAVLCAETLPVGDRNAWQLARALDGPSLRLLRRTVRQLALGEAPVPAPQDESRATWAPVPVGDLLRADFRQSTGRVLRRVRALAPVPGLALEIHGVRVTVTEAEAAREFPTALEPGEAATTDAGVVLRTADGAVLVTRATIDIDGVEEPGSVDARGLADAIRNARA
jgi:methionyl-tRNA formyltransferase